MAFFTFILVFLGYGQSIYLRESLVTDWLNLWVRDIYSELSLSREAGCSANDIPGIPSYNYTGINETLSTNISILSNEAFKQHFCSYLNFIEGSNSRCNIEVNCETNATEYTCSLRKYRDLIFKNDLCSSGPFQLPSSVQCPGNQTCVALKSLQIFIDKIGCYYMDC